MKTLWLASILSTYALACQLPALGTEREMAETGIGLLTYFPWVLINPFWYANPVFFSGCIMLALGNRRLACWHGIVASALAAGFAIVIRFEGIQVGFLLWAASMFGLATAGLIDPRRRPGAAMT